MSLGLPIAGFPTGYPPQYPAMPSFNAGYPGVNSGYGMPIQRVDSRYGIPMSPRGSYVPPVASPAQNYYAAPLTRQQSSIFSAPSAAPQAWSMAAPRGMSYVAPTAIQRTPSMLTTPVASYSPHQGYPSYAPHGVPSYVPQGVPSYVPQGALFVVPHGAPSYVPQAAPTIAPQGYPSYLPPAPIQGYQSYGTRGTRGLSDEQVPQGTNDTAGFAPPMVSPTKRKKRGSCP
mmetsp:Transcript_1717/g.4408  ORF Transcript_1717/g.4408 Transcript_1717/m.4408 type:complete len:230 (+) Transcript_1717:60-749(+)